MKYLMKMAWALPAAGLALSLLSLLGGCGGSGDRAGAESVGAQAKAGAESGAPGQGLVAQAPRVLSQAEKEARQKALAESRRHEAALKVRATQEIAPWARGKLLNSVPVKPGDKVFALTFDDGPWPRSTRQILRILKENGVKATFYMVGECVADRPEIAREVLREGHAIGNHSWDHPSRPRDPIMQVQRTNAQIKKAIGFTPTSFRPPYGIVASMAREAQREGDPVLIWSADSGDWSRPGVSKIVSRILGQATPGGISLMHDGGGDREQSVAALPLIIAGLKARGYTLVTVPELLKHRDMSAPLKAEKPGKKASKRKKRQS